MAIAATTSLSAEMLKHVHIYRVPPSVLVLEAPAGRSTGGLKAASYATKLNANAASAKRSQSQSATFQAALEYRRQQQALAATAAVSAAAAEAAKEADSLTTAADAALAAAAVAKSAAAALERAGDDELLDLADAALPARPSLNGSSSGMGGSNSSSNGLAAQRAQQGGLLANGRQAGSHQHAQRDRAAPNGENRALINGKKRGPLLNGSTPSEDFLRDSPNTSGAGAANGRLDDVPNTNGLSPSQAESSGARSNTSGPSDASSAPLPRSSASEAADDAMTAAIASIHSQQAGAVPRSPAGGKAIPTPSHNAPPRIKSALLAAQEYRKQKAAKTAAMAIAAANAAMAANAAKAASKGGDVPQ